MGDSESMPLQNRVTPDARIVRENWRGDFMGNRGGRIHDPFTKTLLKRKWASKRWIICVTKFKNRHREVMGNSYTEVFFLDEVSALAAGHRPCFECRRKDAHAFAKSWIQTFGKPLGSLADTMDKLLHEERTLDAKLIAEKEFSALPDGVMVKISEFCFAKKDNQTYKWSGNGYHNAELPKGDIVLLTPPSIIAALQNGYEPYWHWSAQ